MCGLYIGSPLKILEGPWDINETAAAAPVSSYIHCGFPSRVAFTFKGAGLANLSSVPTSSSSSNFMLVPSAWKNSYEPYWSFTLISRPDRMICKLHGWHCPSKERAKLWHRSDFLGYWATLYPVCLQRCPWDLKSNTFMDRLHLHAANHCLLPEKYITPTFPCPYTAHRSIFKNVNSTFTNKL